MTTVESLHPDAAAPWPRRGTSRLFADQTYHFQALRALTDVAAGGADVNEVLVAIGEITEGDPVSWFDSFGALALRNESRALSCRDARSAGLAWLRAHTYWRTAEFLLKSHDPRREKAWGKQVGAFDKGLQALGIDYRRFEAPYEESSLRCVFYPGPAGWQDKPLLIVVGGYDSTLEELYFVVAKAAYDRGYAVLTYEGPGQGAALRQRDLTFVPEWERPNGAVLDSYLAQHRKPNAMVLIGMSMGGYLAPRAAAFDDRIDGVVAYDIFYDLGQTAQRYAEISDESAAVANPGVIWAIDNAKWTLGVDTVDDVVERFSHYTLADAAHRICGDVLTLVGAADHFVPIEQVSAFEAACTGARSVETVIYDRVSGGAEHCQLGAQTLWHETLFDWLVRRFETIGR